MDHVIVWQVVCRDRQRTVLPVLYVLQCSGANLEAVRLDSLLNYCIDNDERSATWHLAVVRAVGLLIDFSVAWLPLLQAAHSRHFPEFSRSELLKQFAKAVQKGTAIVEVGGKRDSCGLFWSPRSRTNAKNLLKALTRFLHQLGDGANEWLLSEPTSPSNPYFALQMAHEQVVRRRKSLLAHLSRKERRSLGKHPFSGSASIMSDGRKTHRFPADLVWDFLLRCFRARRSGETDETAQIIALLLFAGGPRLSELFHIWVGDLQWVDDEAVLFLHHPQEGIVQSKDGEVRRMQYLERQARIPRNRLRKSSQQSGFKGLAGDGEGAELIWLPIDEVKELVSTLLRNYVAKTRPRIMRLRRARGLPDHSYLFVGTGRVFGNNTNNIGEPYTISAFRSAWKEAIRRLSVIKNDPDIRMSKRKGTTPHGFRHLYGTFLKTIGCDGDIIARCMHHRSVFSHLRYVALTPQEINAMLRREGGVATKSAKQMFGDVTEAIRRQAQHSNFA